MSEPATETLSVVVEREIPFSPEKIWRALTQPHLIEEWLMKNDFKLSWTTVSIFAQTGALSTVRSWQSSRTKRCLTRGAPMVSRVSSLGLSPLRARDHLRMEQSGFRPDQQQAYQGAKGGWPQFFAKLEQVLARAD